MKKGFTLIELLVVITIIGILASIGAVSYDDAKKRGRDSKRIQDLETIKKALQLYYSDNGRYPNFTWQYSTAGSSWIPGLVPTYIKSLPVDPLNKDTSNGSTAGCAWITALTCYEYGFWSHDTWCETNSASQFILVARLEATTSKSTTRQYINTTGGICTWPGGPTDTKLYVTGE